MANHLTLSEYASMVIVAQQAMTCMDVEEFLETFFDEYEQPAAKQALRTLNLIVEEYVSSGLDNMPHYIISWQEF